MTDDPIRQPTPLQYALALIDQNAADWGPDLVKAALGLLPAVGSLAGFAIDQLPARRMSRVVAYLKLLDQEVREQAARLDELQRQWDARPEASGLFDAGLIAASEATSEARIRRLARTVAAGLTTDEVAAMNAARRIRLLRDIDDGEFAVLAIIERERRITVRYDAHFTWVEDGSITFLSTGETARPADLPTELQAWPLPDLATALNHLAGLGVIEANAAQHSKDYGAMRSYVATPAGQELVRIVVAQGPRSGSA